MSKQIRCPSCGASGTDGMSQLGEKVAFEIRGQWKGKPVRMCNACGAGLTIGVFGAKRINDALWSRMQASWKRNFG